MTNWFFFFLWHNAIKAKIQRRLSCFQEFRQSYFCVLKKDRTDRTSSKHAKSVHGCLPKHTHMHTRPSDGVKKHSLNAKWGWVKEPRTTNIKAVNLAGGYTISHIIYKFKFGIIRYHDKHGAHGRKKGREGSMLCFSSGGGATLRGAHLETSEEKQLGFILFTLKNDCDCSANNPCAPRLLSASSRLDDSNDFCSSTSAADDVDGTFIKSRIQPRFTVRPVQLAQTRTTFTPYVLPTGGEVCRQSSFNLKSSNICTGEFWRKMFYFVSSMVIKQPPWHCLKHIGGADLFTVSLPSQQQVARSFFRGSWNQIKVRHPKKTLQSFNAGRDISPEPACGNLCLPKVISFMVRTANLCKTYGNPSRCAINVNIWDSWWRDCKSGGI